MVADGEVGKICQSVKGNRAVVDFTMSCMAAKGRFCSFVVVRASSANFSH